MVSIPYRLATNRILGQSSVLLLLVSIPYRLATNVLSDVTPDAKEVPFQSLIGWLQTGLSDTGTAADAISFNPL